MNILYVGPYRQGWDGWSAASRDYVSSLLLTNHNISLKPVYMAGGNPPPVTNEIIKAEQNQLDKIDVIIQHVLPDLLEWHEGYNIGLIHTETVLPTDHIWINKINLMDELWVGSEYERVHLCSSGVKCKISVMPVPVNIKLLEKYKNVDPLKGLDNKIVFYFVGEHTDRKNIMAFVKAFHREFSPEENVGIIIKSGDERLKNEINEWKQYSRTRTEYIPEMLACGFLKEEDLYGIHKRGNIFVLSSYGEAQCRPMMDALYFNNRVICSDGIFASDLNPYTSLLVNCSAQVVNTKNPPLPHIYTGKEFWFQIDEFDLQRKMRYAYQSCLESPKDEHTKSHVEKFSLESTAERINKCLSEI